MEMLEGDLADIVVSTFTINESRKERVDFSIPYFTDGLGVLALPGSGIESSSDLKGEMVIVRRSTTGFDWAKENLKSDNVISSVDVEQVVEHLLSKNAQAYINDKSSLDAMASRNPGVVVLPLYLTGENWGVAVAKGRPGLLKAINSFIRKMTSDGTLVRLRSKWIKPN